MMKEPAEHLYIFLIVTFDILQPHVCRQALDLTVLDRCVLSGPSGTACFRLLSGGTNMHVFNEPTAALLLSVTRV